MGRKQDMDTGKVTEIKYRYPKGQNPAVVYIDEERYSFFSDYPVSLDGIDEGDKVKYRAEPNDGHMNLREISVVEKNTSSSSKGDEMKKGAALKAAARVSSSPDDAKDTAKEFYQLLKEGDWDEG